MREISAKDMVECEDVNELYKTQVELTEDISITHKEIREAQTESEKSAAQGDLSILYSLLEVCKHRIEDLKDTGAKMNYNFRMAARMVLTKETYQKIMDLSYKTRKEVKAISHEYKNNKLQ